MPTRRQSQADTTPQAPQSTPSTLGLPAGASDYTAFTWQQLNDIQGNIGKLQQAIETQTAALGKLEDKTASIGEKINAINVKLAARQWWLLAHGGLDRRKHLVGRVGVAARKPSQHHR